MTHDPVVCVWGSTGWPAWVACRHALVDDLRLLNAAAVHELGGHDEQAVASLPRLRDQGEQGLIGLAVQGGLGDRRVGLVLVCRGLGERVPVVRGRVEGERDHRADQDDGGEAEQHEQDAPAHGDPSGSARRKP